jgi:hypothetical protein
VFEGQAAEENPYDVGYSGDGKVLKPGATYGLGKFEEKFIEELAKAEGTFVEGFSPIPQDLELSPAQKAARRMEKLIHDQIEESSGTSELRSALFEAAMMGTGIIKGPFNFNKTLNKWDEDEEGSRTYNPLEVRVPRIEFVSCWDFY